MSARTRVAGLAGALAIALAGCSSGSGPHLTAAYDAKNPQTWSFEQLIDQAVTDATTGGADDAQLDELAIAKKHGTLSVEQMRSASEAVRDCLADAGATVSAMTDSSHLGQWLPSFTYAPPPGVTDETFDNTFYSACDTQHRAYVGYVYSNQPAAREALGTALVAHEEQLKQCLTDMGGQGVDDMTLNEL